MDSTDSAEAAEPVPVELKRSRLGGKSSSNPNTGKRFSVAKGLKVCFLTDCLCRGVTSHIKNITAIVHPSATLSHTLLHGARQLDKVSGEKLVVIHIGTEDISRGVTPNRFIDQFCSTIVLTCPGTTGGKYLLALNKMLALIHRIQLGRPERVYFAVCTVLPRPVDDLYTKALVMQCNKLLQECCAKMHDVAFLQTNRKFFKFGKAKEKFYRRDGLHLNSEGRRILFTFLKNFLWHFCHHDIS